VIFEWDERKRRENLGKHGFDFADCPAILGGPTITVADERFDYGEPRFLVSALLRGRAVVVAYVEVGDTIRVISMRKANKREQAFYYESLPD
jgi:uncharacterized DUF497 family protein